MELGLLTPQLPRWEPTTGTEHLQPTSLRAGAQDGAGETVSSYGRESFRTLAPG